MIILKYIFDIPCSYLKSLAEYYAVISKHQKGIVRPSLTTLILVPVLGIVAL